MKTETERLILLVTGLSGAGKTAVFKALEDLGYETIDNLPLALFAPVVAPTAGQAMDSPIAIGVDVRTRGFGVDALAAEIDRLRREKDFQIKVLFVDCSDQELLRRYTETRHRHPLAQDRPVSDGIRLERTLLAPLRGLADVVQDTTQLTLGELKERMRIQFGGDNGDGLAIFVTSFGFKRGLPLEADLVFDVRFLANPYYDAQLRPLTGLDEAVVRAVSKTPVFEDFMDHLKALIGPLLPYYAAEGKSYLTIAIGCTGGRHRSVVVVEQLAEWLAQTGYKIQLRHRELTSVSVGG